LITSNFLKKYLKKSVSDLFFLVKVTVSAASFNTCTSVEGIPSGVEALQWKEQ
jgi:hypothetical protein